MASQRKRLEKALRGCAEAGVPDTVDLWPVVRERATGGRADAESRYSLRAASRKRIGWLVAALIAVLLTGTGAYAATSGAFDRIFATMLPEVPETNLEKVEVGMGTDNGFTLTVDRAYVDQYHVVAGYTLTGPDGRRWDSDEITGALTMEQVGGKWLPESSVSNLSEWLPKGEEGKEVGAFAFEPMEPFEAGATVRLRATLDLMQMFNCREEGPGRSCDARPRARPSVVFEARVREVEVLEVNETAESNGLPMTLTGIVDSPVSTSANLCFEPEDGNDQPVVSWRRPDGSSTKPNSWTILPKGESLYVSGVFRQGQMFGQGAANEAGCATVKWSGTLSDEPGVHSLTVTRLEPSFMNSRGPEAGPPKEGSWKFSFEVPGG